MAIRDLKIFEKSITPVHVHHEKEKAYVRLSQATGATSIVFMFIKGTWEAFQLVADGHPVNVPPGTPHALYTSTSIELLVITSTQNAEDIEWEAEGQ